MLVLEGRTSLFLVLVMALMSGGDEINDHGQHLSSINVCLFVQHAAQICPTRMTSCMLFEKMRVSHLRLLFWREDGEA